MYEGSSICNETICETKDQSLTLSMVHRTILYRSDSFNSKVTHINCIYFTSDCKETFNKVKKVCCFFLKHKQLISKNGIFIVFGINILLPTKTLSTISLVMVLSRYPLLRCTKICTVLENRHFGYRSGKDNFYCIEV